jgi:hypothetical protein
VERLSPSNEQHAHRAYNSGAFDSTFFLLPSSLRCSASFLSVSRYAGGVHLEAYREATIMDFCILLSAFSRRLRWWSALSLSSSSLPFLGFFFFHCQQQMPPIWTCISTCRIFGKRNYSSHFSSASSCSTRLCFSFVDLLLLVVAVLLTAISQDAVFLIYPVSDFKS